MLSYFICRILYFFSVECYYSAILFHSLCFLLSYFAASGHLLCLSYSPVAGALTWQGSLIRLRMIPLGGLRRDQHQPFPLFAIYCHLTKCSAIYLLICRCLPSRLLTLILYNLPSFCISHFSLSSFPLICNECLLPYIRDILPR